MNRKRWLLGLVIAYFVAGSFVEAGDFHDEVDKLFAPWDFKDSPGCVVLLRHDGKTVHERAYGMADLETGRTLSLSSVFLLASVSKQFIVFALMLLAQGGGLSLDDDVRKHVPELPDFKKTITIRHLIHHTSGLREDLTLFNLAGWRSGDAITRADFLRLVKNQKELNFDPGAEYLYCNTGYHLLAIIAERVSKQPFPQFAREKLFTPLGMKHTTVREDHRALLPGLAAPYGPVKGGFQLRRVAHDPPGASNVHSTVGDLALWDQNFYDAKLGGKKILDLMQQKGKLNSGKEISYAGGLQVSAYRGLKTVSHTGSHGGYKTVLLRFPDQRFSAIILANVRDFNPMRMARKVADIGLRDQLKPRPALPAEVAVEKNLLDACAGEYLVGHNLWKVRTDKQGLILDADGEKKQLVPFAEMEFFDREDGARYRFQKTKDGMSLTATSPDRKLIGQRLRVVAIPAEKMASFAGTYLSEELGVLTSVVVREGSLFLRLPKGEFLLQPLAGGNFLARPSDAFFSVLTVRFSTTGDAQIDGFALTTERVRNLRYRRVKLEER